MNLHGPSTHLRAGVSAREGGPPLRQASPGFSSYSSYSTPAHACACKYRERKKVSSIPLCTNRSYWRNRRVFICQRSDARAPSFFLDSWRRQPLAGMRCSAAPYFRLRAAPTGSRCCRSFADPGDRPTTASTGHALRCTSNDGMQRAPCCAPCAQAAVR